MTHHSPGNFLEMKNISKHYLVQGKLLKVVDDVSLSFSPGKTLALIGESGSGKSTLGRILLRLEDPSSGRILLHDRDITNLSSVLLRPLRRQLQIVFQDPYSSLNPRMKIREILSEPLDIHYLSQNSKRQPRIRELLDMVGLNTNFADRFPHELSGGQRQRIAIARALAVEPQFIVLDEPLSSLDMTIQSQIIDLLLHLKRILGLGYLFISHDLDAVHALADCVAVMYKGNIIEQGSKDQIYQNQQHPYTKKLFSHYYPETNFI